MAKSMAETQAKLVLTKPSDLEIAMERVFDAPRHLVFQAYVDRDLIPRWWGRRANETIVDKMDVRPGGEWRFIQRDGDGNEFAFHGVYREVRPPERLGNTFEFEGMPGHVVVEQVTLEDLGERTRVRALSRFESSEDRDGMIASGMEEGAIETWDRLAELVESTT